MRHERLRNILAAGALTGLVLATILAFGWQDARRTEAQDDVRREAGAVPAEDALRAENEQLRQAVDTLQQREGAYQSQIEVANQTIRQLEGTGSGRFEDDDEWEEDEEHEHEEHEEHDDD